jgi:3-dehydroquinate synthase class II
MPLDPDLVGADQHERRFVANRSMRDVEGAVDVYVMKLKESAVALADEHAGEDT